LRIFSPVSDALIINQMARNQPNNEAKKYNKKICIILADLEIEKKTYFLTPIDKFRRTTYISLIRTFDMTMMDLIKILVKNKIL